MSSLASYTLHDFVYEGITRQFYFVPGAGSHQLDALVVALHPYTGSPEWMFQKYQALHKRGFHMLMPVGRENSWNGGACCGSAVRLGLNDAGFIQELATTVMRQKMLKPARAYVIGHSNGAFLASEIALRAASHGSRWVRSVALVVGYSYDKYLYEAAVGASHTNKDSAVPILALHGTDDRAVRIEGCCGEETCCCGIIARTCFSFRDELAEWVKINRCDAVKPALPSSPALQRMNASTTCMVGRGCLAPVQFCETAQAGHDLQNFVPVGEAVAEWFMADYHKHKESEQQGEISAEGFVAKHPPRAETHDDVTGVAIIIFFLLALFSFLAMVFKRSGGVRPDAVGLKTSASARELQSLTGRTTPIVAVA